MTPSNERKMVLIVGAASSRGRSRKTMRAAKAPSATMPPTHGMATAQRSATRQRAAVGRAPPAPALHLPATARKRFLPSAWPAGMSVSTSSDRRMRRWLRRRAVTNSWSPSTRSTGAAAELRMIDEVAGAHVDRLRRWTRGSSSTGDVDGGRTGGGAARLAIAAALAATTSLQVVRAGASNERRRLRASRRAGRRRRR